MGNKTLHSATGKCRLGLLREGIFVPNGDKGWVDMHYGEDADEVIRFCFVPGKVLLEEIGKSAGNWYSVQHFLAAFLSFFVVYKDKIFYSRNSA